MDPRLLAGVEMIAPAIVLRHHFKQADEGDRVWWMRRGDSDEVGEDLQEAMALLSAHHGIEEGLDPERWHYHGEDSDGVDPDGWEYRADSDSKGQALRGKPKSDVPGKKKLDGRANRDGDGDGLVFDGTPKEKMAAARPSLVMAKMLRVLAHA
jgi:hypothetical protein